MAYQANWFEEVVRYSGSARIELSSPKAILIGSFEYVTEPKSQASLKVRIEKTHPPKAGLEIMTLFGKPVPTSAPQGGNQGYTEFRFGVDLNPCLRVELLTEEGVLKPLWTPNYSFTAETNLLTISFEPHGWVYEMHDSGTAKYWVAPLEDFSGPYQFRGPELARNHPLRLKSDLVTPEEAQKLFPFRMLVGDTGTHLIPFIYKQRDALIEGLGHVKEITEEDDGTVKAILLAELDHEHEADPYKLDWYPEHLFSLLALATGNPLSVPWLEFRDSTSRLVSRVHYPFTYTPGKRSSKQLLRESSWVGQLLSEACDASARSEEALISALKNASRSLSDSISIEEMVMTATVGLDAVCSYFGCATENLTKSCSPAVGQEVIRILNYAAREIRILKKSHPSDAPFIDTISSRTINAGQSENAFGLSVAKLCRELSFQDPVVMESFARATLTGNSETWQSSLSQLRGKIVHRGTCTPDFSPIQAYDLGNHLRDILVRALWKAFGYTGPYQPTMAIHLIARATADWVTNSNTSKHLLPNIGTT